MYLAHTHTKLTVILLLLYVHKRQSQCGLSDSQPSRFRAQLAVSSSSNTAHGCQNKRSSFVVTILRRFLFCHCGKKANTSHFVLQSGTSPLHLSTTTAIPPEGLSLQQYYCLKRTQKHFFLCLCKNWREERNTRTNQTRVCGQIDSWVMDFEHAYCVCDWLL